MKYLINKTKLFGKVDGITSKSFGHRALMLACFGDSIVEITDLPMCEDIVCTIEILKKLGASFAFDENSVVRITPIDRNKIESGLKLNCGESGSTLRFILPILAMLNVKAEIDGSERLKERPVGALINTLKSSGAKFSAEKLPLKLLKGVDEAIFYVDGSISSQFVTGIMLALAIAKKQGTIVIAPKIVSKGYIDITINVLGIFNVDVKDNLNSFTVFGKEVKSPKLLKIEKDWSNNAVWLVAGILNGEIEVEAMNLYSLQGDKNIYEILKKMKGNLSLISEKNKKFYQSFSNEILMDNEINGVADNNMEKKQGCSTRLKAENDIDLPMQETILALKSELHPLKINIDCNIDLAPIISLCCALAKGDSMLYNVERLRDKESDRLLIIIETLKILGIKTELIKENVGKNLKNNEENVIESLKIYGKNIEEIKTGKLRFNSFNDHRFVMMQAIIGSIFGNTEIENPLAVNKSYPSFFEDFRKVGGKFEKLN